MCRYECDHLRFRTPNTSLHGVSRVYSNTHNIEHIFFSPFAILIHITHVRLYAHRYSFFSSCFLIACDYVVTASFEISASQFECLRLRLTEFQYAFEMVLLASILRFIFIRRSHLIRLSSCRSLRCRRRNRYYYWIYNLYWNSSFQRKKITFRPRFEWELDVKCVESVMCRKYSNEMTNAEDWRK